MYTDSTEMRVFLIYHLLRSIRMDFSKDSALKERHNLALKLCDLAVRDYEHRADWTKEHGDSNYYGSYHDNRAKALALATLRETIKWFKPGSTDGRYFRYEFPDGYEGMLERFGLEDKQ